MLRLEGVHAFYGAGHILHGVDLSVGRGEVVTQPASPVRSSDRGKIGRRVTGRIDDDGRKGRGAKRVGHRRGQPGGCEEHPVAAATIQRRRIAEC